MPVLVIPALPPKVPNVEAAPRLIAGAITMGAAAVVKLQTLLTASAFPAKSSVAVVTVAV